MGEGAEVGVALLNVWPSKIVFRFKWGDFPEWEKLKKTSFLLYTRSYHFKIHFFSPFFLCVFLMAFHFVCMLTLLPIPAGVFWRVN